MDRINPLGLSVLGTVQLGQNPWEEKIILTRIVQDGLRWDLNRTSLLENWRALTKLRYGVRKPKTFPWKGASNLSIPYIDENIRKYKPMLFRLIAEAHPVVEFLGEDPDSVGVERVAESVYDWLFRTEMQAYEPLAYTIDSMCHRGHAWLQVGWDYQTEYEVRSVSVFQLFRQAPRSPQEIAMALIQEYDLNLNDPSVIRSLQGAVNGILQGQEFVKLAYRKVQVDRPVLWDRDAIQMIVPTRCTDPGQAECLIVQHMLSLRKVQRLEADGFFVRGFAARIARDIYDRQTGSRFRAVGSVDPVLSRSLYAERRLQDEREKVWGIEDEDNILVWEVYHWEDINRDGLAERVVTFLHPASLTNGGSREFSYPFSRWPFIKFDFEKTSRRLNAPRGISALLKDIQRELNTQHNQRIDGMTLRNSPVYQVPTLAGFKAKNFRCVPGQVLQLPAGAQITPVMQDRSAFPEMVSEENLLRAVGERYIGNFDANLTSPQSVTRARTATEITASMQYQATVASFDAMVFQLCHMQPLHTMVWQLFMDLGPAEIFARIGGEDPQTGQPLLQPVKKSEINKKFKLIPTGTIANTNRALQLANVREALQIYLQDQTGFINPYELRKAHLDLLDYRRSRKILNPPNQAQELQTLRQAAQAIKMPEMQAALGMQQPQVEPPQVPAQNIVQIPGEAPL